MSRESYGSIRHQLRGVVQAYRSSDVHADSGQKDYTPVGSVGVNVVVTLKGA